MSTTALRCTVPTEPDALIPAADIYGLISDVAAYERDLISARARNATLLREMKRLLIAPKIVGQSTVDGMLTLVYDTGRVVQLQPFADYGQGMTEYGFKWVELTPAPDAPAAIVDDALAGEEVLEGYTGMGVVA
jgi:hypothetical protein